MGFDFLSMLSGKAPDETPKLTLDEAAELLKTSPEALSAFEKAYAIRCMDDGDQGQIGINSRQASAKQHEVNDAAGITDDALVLSSAMQNQVVGELLAQTEVYVFDGDLDHRDGYASPLPELPANNKLAITTQTLKGLPEHLRVQLTGDATVRDIKDMSYESLLYFYKEAIDQTKDAKYCKSMYDHFRSGLDFLDLDPVVYAMLDMNPNAMGHWLPALVEACRGQDFFKIPATRVAKVPMTLLQMTRMDYSLMTPATLSVVDKWAMEAFDLDESKDYFIKTGTYSSKFDFRNAKVTAGKEVTELGEYLLFIQSQACAMAGPLGGCYGASTTNEWVVREFIHDKEDNPCIYKGLPLHTEYRVFVDCDTDKVIAYNPYWDPEVMLKRFNQGDDANSPHQKHDYVVYKAHEETLMARYHANIDAVVEHIKAILPNLDLKGQWSIDVMQNGDEFWLIDIATAETSAFKEKIPEVLRRPRPENWLPRIEAPVLPEND